MFRNLLRHRAAVVGLAAVLALGVFAGAGIALASGSGGGESATGATSQAGVMSLADATSTATPSTGTTGKLSCHAKFRIAKGIIKDVAAKSGIPAKTLVADLKDGKTLNEILGSNAASIEQQVVADAQARIQAAEQAGKLTQEQAQKLSAKAPDAISKFFSTVHTPGQHSNATNSSTAPAGAS